MIASTAPCTAGGGRGLGGVGEAAPQRARVSLGRALRQLHPDDAPRAPGDAAPPHGGLEEAESLGGHGVPESNGDPSPRLVGTCGRPPDLRGPSGFFGGCLLGAHRFQVGEDGLSLRLVRQGEGHARSRHHRLGVDQVHLEIGDGPDPAVSLHRRRVDGAGHRGHLAPTTPASDGPAMFRPGSMLWQVPHRRRKSVLPSGGSGRRPPSLRPGRERRAQVWSGQRSASMLQQIARLGAGGLRSDVMSLASRVAAPRRPEHRRPPSRGAAPTPRGRLRLRRRRCRCGIHPPGQRLHLRSGALSSPRCGGISRRPSWT